MSLFDTDDILSANIQAANQSLAEQQLFTDLRDWHAANPKRRIPPDPAAFAKDALAQRPGMEWLAALDVQLIYPTQPDPAWQAAYLADFVRIIKAEATYLTQGFCPNFPEGYNEPLLALDTETTGLDTRLKYDYFGRLNTRCKIVGLCLGTSNTRGYYLPVRHTQEDGVPNWDAEVIRIFLDQLHREFAIIYHNASYDREVCALAGVQDFRPYPYFFDTQVLDFFYDVNNKSHGLKPASKRHLNRQMIEIQELFHGLGAAKTKEHIFFDTLPATTGMVYGASDACNTFGLFGFYAGQPEHINIFTQQSLPLEIDHKLVDVRRRMSRTGMPVNLQYYYYAAHDAIYRAGRIEQFIYTLAGRKIELGSPKQLSELLFNPPSEGGLGLTAIDANGKIAEKGKNGAYSTGEEILDALFKKHPDVLLLKYIVLYRKVQGSIEKTYLKCLANSFVDSVIPYARVQLDFSQTNVPTGRLSSSSSDGAERVTLKVSGKTAKKSYKYFNGSWDCGFNSQGIPNPINRKMKAKRIKCLPPEAGIDLTNLYPDWVRQQFLQSLAEM